MLIGSLHYKMYKKYIKKKGKRFGPYYFTSIRKNSKVKSYYLGSNEKKAKKKENEIKGTKSWIKFPVIGIILAITLVLLFINPAFLGYVI